MAMSKASLREWPHNGQPSSRHVWRETGTYSNGNHSSRCDRCGRGFNAFADTRGPVYCYPSKEWLASHPGDDGMLGAVRTPFG
jgi:hypothetical protein